MPTNVEMKRCIARERSALVFWSPDDAGRRPSTRVQILDVFSLQVATGYTRVSFAVPCGQYRFKLHSELRDRLPGEMQQFLLERQHQRLKQRIPPARGVAIEEISNLHPDFQTLAYLMQRGDETTQQEAQRQYWQHLINLYINDTSTSGDIDYDYLYNNVIGFWRNLKSASYVQAAPARFIDPPA